MITFTIAAFIQILVFIFLLGVLAGAAFLIEYEAIGRNKTKVK